MRECKNLMVTGGLGFMGSDFVRFLFQQQRFQGKVLVVDRLTYAADRENLSALAREQETGRLKIEIADIQQTGRMAELLGREGIQAVVNFAAETHVDRSIAGASVFGLTNVCGTVSLLEAARSVWGMRSDVLFHQVSTDEVFGSCPPEGAFREDDRYWPSSPYAASKAGADHMVRAFGHTYGLPYTISHACNNYGPYQTPEKLIPLVITRLAKEAPIPVYGTGKNVREWLFVRDHSRAVWTILTRSEPGRTYNVGSGERTENLTIIDLLGKEVARALGREETFHQKLIQFVEDRPGHDTRYALDSSRVRSELGWEPAYGLQAGLREAVRWYLDNTQWVTRAHERLSAWLAGEGTVWARR